MVVIPVLCLSLTPPTLAQDQSALQAEADKLLQQGIRQFQISQYREAFQSWQNALTIYREIGDRGGEANSLNNLGNAYYSLGEYARAIEFYQQSLA
ncbi:MAG: tetratricopeptide repeat protein, partial [Xenococcaceae cyanobacterium MO_188.B32]|nr:tetratricopeptide repeat protein [Xenococcaceae cyanobacterium MO_188.B32]